MAEVVTVEKAEPVVKGITLKITVGEATDLRLFIEDWYRRKPYMPPASANKVHQAITLGLKGKTTSQEKVDKAFNEMLKGPQVFAARASF